MALSDVAERTDSFKERLRRTEGKPEYIFFDDPPFATGLPHYGHNLAGTLKASQRLRPGRPQRCRLVPRCGYPHILKPHA
ncbi:putative isoleucine--tRNA ligase, cytoplasmic [Tetrabaena socialis]|uniref:Putative isoleucine--tRNA ligase, cytoplasmic n=1 Tax=Tetrabaena socialis TaxID=47790 RepID=A0A2J7ZRN2_9CHLO|nr:putative isoleucine--tRNA ligase, cytoplasmic [Tetrabaena socialis]|eukprot:PNH02929.1 putative isoleucine--tRNA ligase, cytoplasmic [Tetrabaena socialis]